jgi:hypothetical protein
MVKGRLDPALKVYGSVEIQFHTLTSVVVED